MSDRDSASGHTGIVREVYERLDKNPLLSPKDLATLLGYNYGKYRNYLTKLKYEWRRYHKDKPLGRCSSVHYYKGKLLLDRKFSDELRANLLQHFSEHSNYWFGWEPTKARNKYFIFHGKLGRVVWHTTGTVTFHVKKPADLVKAKKLFWDAFNGTELIPDTLLMSKIADGLVEGHGLRSLGVYQKELHAPYLTEQRLPSLTITDFEKSHGITIKIGDRSHPNAVEVIAQFSTQTEQLIEQTGRIARLLENKQIDNESLKENIVRITTAFDKLLAQQSPQEPDGTGKFKGDQTKYVT